MPPWFRPVVAPVASVAASHAEPQQEHFRRILPQAANQALPHVEATDDPSPGVRLRYAPLIGLPLEECEPHLQGILRKLDARGPPAADVAAELRREVETLRRRLSRNEGARVRRVREGDGFALVRADGVRFLARRRLDRGEGWVLVGPHGLVLGNYRTLPDCEAAASRA